MAERFADRLVPNAFRGDEPWCVGVVGVGHPVDWALSLPDEQADIPERIAERLLALGRAYALHHLSTLDSSEQNRLNADQAAGLLEEVQFLLGVVDDLALREHLKPLIAFAERCSRSRQIELLLEGP